VSHRVYVLQVRLTGESLCVCTTGVTGQVSHCVYVLQVRLTGESLCVCTTGVTGQVSHCVYVLQVAVSVVLRRRCCRCWCRRIHCSEAIETLTNRRLTTWLPVMLLLTCHGRDITDTDICIIFNISDHLFLLLVILQYSIICLYDLNQGCGVL